MDQNYNIEDKNLQGIGVNSPQQDIIVLTPHQIKKLAKSQEKSQIEPAKGASMNFLIVILLMSIIIMFSFIIYTTFAKPMKDLSKNNSFNHSSYSFESENINYHLIEE